ncbi:hypothetical protein D3C87_1659080 [compost metagenome]
MKYFFRVRQHQTPEGLPQQSGQVSLRFSQPGDGRNRSGSCREAEFHIQHPAGCSFFHDQPVRHIGIKHDQLSPLQAKAFLLFLALPHFDYTAPRDQVHNLR